MNWQKRFKKSKNKSTAPNGRFGASGVHLVGQLAVFSRFSSRPSVSGNPACRQAASTKNVTAGKRFVEENHPDRVNLYNDFVKYLDNIFSEDDILELNIVDMANFCGIDFLFGDIKNVIDSISGSRYIVQSNFESADSVYSFVGDDVFFDNQFKDYSVEYLEYCLKEEKERELRNRKSGKQQSKEKIKEKFKNIFMCVGGIAFIGASILVIRDGNYF